MDTYAPLRVQIDAEGGIVPVLEGVTPVEARASARINGVPDAFTDVPGCVVNFDTSFGSSLVLAWAIFDFDKASQIGGTIIHLQLLGALAVDGVREGPLAVCHDLVNTTAHQVGGRKTIGQQWLLSGLAVGSHEVKLQARSPAGPSPGYIVYEANTVLTVLVLDL